MESPTRPSTKTQRPRRPHRARSPRATGLLIALALALIGGGVVLFVALLDKSAPNVADRVQRPAGGKGGADEPTDITAVGSTKDARIQIVDKERPGRVAADLLFARLDRVGGGTFDATLPRAFIYLLDGRTIYVRSDTGRVRMPSQSDAPESGEFSGNGLVLVFPARAPGDARPIDPERDEPGLVAHFKAASFDTVLLEASTRDELTIETAGSSARMLGALVRGNQVRKRLEFARFGPGEFHYHIDDDGDPNAEPAGEPEARTATRVRERGDRQPHAPDAHSTQASTGSATNSTPAATGPSDSKSADTSSIAKMQEDLYRAVFTGGVTLSQATRQLTGDTLTVWSRFIDNKLPEGALGPRPKPARGAALSPEPMLPYALGGLPPRLEVVVSALVLANIEPTRTLFAPRPTDVILTWKKEVTTAPIAAAAPPRELDDGNHVHARFTADKPAGDRRITITDSEIGAAGVCGILDYAATKRQLTLDSSASMDRVDFTAPAVGRFRGPNVSINLISGLGQVRGGGTLLSLATEGMTVVPEADPDAPLPESATRRITWTDQADFKFFTKPGEQAIDDVLESSSFTGEVFARDHWSSLSGDFLKIDFDRVQTQNGKARSSPRHLHIEGGALAVGAPSPSHADADRPLPPLDPHLAAETLDIDFEPASQGDGDVIPTRVVAHGTSGEGKGKWFVRVSDGESSLTAMDLIAGLKRGQNGKVEIDDVFAEQQVRIERNDGVWATADKLVASGVGKWADLTSENTAEPVALGRGDGTVIRGPQIHLEDATGLMHVFGLGWLDHLQASDSTTTIDPALAALADPDVPPGMTRVRASWTKSMLFVNATGRIECHGDAEVSARSATEGQVARCERLLLNITPEPKQVATASTVEPASPTIESNGTPLGDTLLSGMGDRRLLSAEMIGAITERDGGPLASVKSWKFGVSAGGAGERTFDQVLYLESPRLSTDETTGLITVPDAGTGLVFDAGKQSATAGSSGAAAPSVGPSGDTRFRWKKSLTFNRATGVLKMLEDVELEHLALGSTSKLTMRCPELSATLDARKSAAGGGGKLISATCGGPGGGAIAESGTQLLTADEFVYDGLADVIRAVSKSDRPAMFTDTQRAAPVLAKSLIWDRRADRIEVVEPMPVTGPMGK